MSGCVEVIASFLVLFHIITSPRYKVPSISMSVCVCLCVCPLAYISKTACLNVTKSSVHVIHVAVARYFADGNTSGFVDVLFYSKVTQQGAATGGG